jgi:hypothetical protein
MKVQTKAIFAEPQPADGNWKIGGRAGGASRSRGVGRDPVDGDFDLRFCRRKRSKASLKGSVRPVEDTNFDLMRAARGAIGGV